MNGKQSKKANVKAKEIIIDWLISVVPEEDAHKITAENFSNFLPEDKYFIAKKSKWVSFYTVRWAKKNIKKLKHLHPILKAEMSGATDIFGLC